MKGYLLLWSVETLHLRLLSAKFKGLELIEERLLETSVFIVCGLNSFHMFCDHPLRDKFC